LTVPTNNQNNTVIVLKFTEYKTFKYLAKQEADRQLHDIQQVLKQEAESQATNTTTQQVKKQPISQEEMEKHLIQKLFLQASGGIPATDAVCNPPFLKVNRLSNSITGKTFVI
jgi:hypothetical protein